MISFSVSNADVFLSCRLLSDGDDVEARSRHEGDLRAQITRTQALHVTCSAVVPTKVDAPRPLRLTWMALRHRHLQAPAEGVRRHLQQLPNCTSVLYSSLEYWACTFRPHAHICSANFQCTAADACLGTHLAIGVRRRVSFKLGVRQAELRPCSHLWRDE